MSQTDFDNNPKSFNMKTTSNKTKVRKKLISQKKQKTKNDYNFFLGRICFTNNDGSEGIWILLLTGNQMEYIHRFKRLYTAFLHSIRLSGYKMEKKKDKYSAKKAKTFTPAKL